MDELPEEFAVQIGRIVHYAGHAEAHLCRLLPTTEDQPGSLGLSGEQLIKKLRQLPAAPELDLVVDGYGELYEWRNTLIHSAFRYSGGALWLWRDPIKGKGRTGVSYTLRLDHLRQVSESWRSLAASAHDLLQQQGVAEI